MDAREELLAGLLQRVDADRRHHRARDSRGKTLPHFTKGSHVLVARTSKQGKQLLSWNTHSLRGLGFGKLCAEFEV